MKNTSLEKIVFIGSGKVATALSEALKRKRGIIQVYSKTLTNARKLGQKLGCSFTNDLKKISQDADLYVIAVKDDAIEEVCKKLNLKDKIVVHTSGSTSIEVLKKVSTKCGVLWAMYSFSGSVGNGFKPFPTEQIAFFIEASDKKTEKELTALVKEMKGKPYYITSEKRAILHLAAVFVNNFPNHLFTIAEALCKEAGISFSLFLPLAQETVENLSQRDSSGKTQSPALSQTGPAARNDKRILNKHLVLLKTHPAYKAVYKALTQSIIQEQKKNSVKTRVL